MFCAGHSIMPKRMKDAAIEKIIRLITDGVEWLLYLFSYHIAKLPEITQRLGR